MDFYVVISILGPPEAATSRFLFHMAILSEWSYKTDENGKGKFEEETTQTVPCRPKAQSDLAEKSYYHSATFSPGLGKAAVYVLICLYPQL